MRSLAAMALLVLGGCSQPMPMPACGPPSGFTPAPVVFGRVGQPLSVELVVDNNCDDTVVMSVKVTVSDPNNLPVDVGEATRSVMPNDTGVQTTVSFTPQLAGPYHFVGRFEPNLGVAQSDILVSSDRTQEAPAFAADESTDLGKCTHVDITPASRLLCLAPSVELFEPDAGLLQMIGPPQSTAGYLGGVLWMLSPAGDLTRWVEASDAGFVRTPDTSFPFSDTAVQLLPTADDVVLLDTTTAELTRIGATDAGLSMTGNGVFTSFGGQFTVAWHGGDDVVGVSTSSVNSGNVCTFSFAASPTMPNCTFLNAAAAAAVGVDHAGAWVFDTSFASVLTAFTSTKTSALTVPMGTSSESSQNISLFESGPSLNIGDGFHTLVSLDDHGFGLATLPNHPLVSITSTAVTLQESPRLVIYRR